MKTWTYTPLAAVTAALLAASPAMAQDAVFAGKQIDVVVPFSQGGATDVAARFLEPYLQKHLPGGPQINVVNRPGGGSILGANWFQENAKSDGTTILFTTSSTANPYVLGQKEVAYDLASMRVGYSLPFGAVVYVAPSTGVETPADLKNPDQPLIYGGIAAAASDLPTLLSFEVLEIDVRSVLGFPGRGPIRLAFERGETNIDFQFTPVYLTQVVDQVEAGRAVPVYSGGSIGEDGRLTERDPAAPDIPSVYEVYRQMYDKEPSGVAWDAFQAIGAVTFNFGLTAYLPEGTPDDVIAAFEDTVERINSDPEFQKASQEVIGGYSLIKPSNAQEPLRAALQPSDEVRSYLRTLLADKYGVNF